MKALIVEDDVFFCSIIMDAIESRRLNWKVLVASTGKEAITLLQEAADEIGLVFVDLGLPDMEGAAVIRASQEACPQARILVISSRTGEDSLLAAIRSGAAGYVVKGDAHMSVSRAIEQLMGGLYPVSPQMAGFLLKRVVGNDPVVDELMSESAPLTPREKDLLVQFAGGASYAQAADRMGISLATVQTHARNLYRKLGVRSCLQALSKAKAEGLLR